MKSQLTRASTAAVGLAAALVPAWASAPAAAQEAPVTQMADDPALEWGACPPIFPTGCEIAVVHGDPSQPNADVFLRVPSGYAIPPHSHTSAERMIAIAGALEVRYQGAAAATLAPGEYAYGPAGLPHEATCAGEETCVLFIAFEGPVDAVAFDGPLN